MIEHLEDPQKLLKNIAENLKEHGKAFVTLALTAAEVDHIYEIKFESEAVKLAKNSGLRVLETLSLGLKILDLVHTFCPGQWLYFAKAKRRW